MAYWTGTDEVLEEDEVYTSPTRLTERHDTVAGAVYTDVAGVIYIEQSSDGENWDISSSYAVPAADGKGFSEPLLLAFWRIRFDNTGGDDQTEFRLSARTIAGGDS